MLDRSEELDLFVMLAERVLAAGGFVKSSGMKWYRQAEIYLRENENKKIKESSRTWSSAAYAAQDLWLHAERDGIDRVVFHGSDDAGVPWRMLKLDCPFLAIVAGDAKKALRVLDGRIAHLSALLDKTLYANEEKYDDRN